MEKTRILIVEDEVIISDELKSELSENGYFVTGVAVTGEEAVAKVTETNPDIIIMDITLRGPMTGIDAAEVIGKTQSIPIIYLSASSDEATIKKVESSGSYGFIIKPYTHKELQANIEIALLRHRLEKQFIDRSDWLTSTFDSMGDAVIATDRNSIIRRMNPLSEKLTGWNKEEAIGKKVSEVFITIDEKTGEDLTNSLLKNRELKVKDSLLDTQILISRAGEHIYIEKSAEPIKDEAGNILGVVLIFRDVTEKRTLQQKMLDSEKKFRHIFDQAGDAIFLLEKEVCVDFNDKAGKLYGFNNTSETSAGCVIERMIRNKITKGEYVLSTLGGSLIEAEITRATVDIGNKLLDLVFIHDISERNELENALQKSEKQYRQLVELAEEGIWSLDNNFETVFANPRMAEMAGLTVSGMLGKSFYSFFKPEESAFFPKIVGRKKSRKNKTFEARLIRKEKPFIYVSIAGTPLIGEDGKITGYIFVVSDITDIKKEQDEIRKLSFAIEQSPSCIIITDISGSIEYVNSRFEELTLYSREEVIGRNPGILKSGDMPAKDYAHLWNTIKNGGTWRGFFHNKKKNGDLYWESASISPIKNGEGVITHFIALKEDITEKKSAEEKLQKTLAEFADLNKNLDKKVQSEVEKNREMDQMLIQQSRLAAMGEMIGNIAHQWRQPINALGIIIQNIEQSFDYNKLTKKYIEDAVNKAMSIIMYMSHTIDDFRNFFKHDKEQEDFSINDAVKKTISFIESSLRDHNITINFVSDREIVRKGYPNEYCQAIMNLLSNVKDVVTE
ncbi:MAG: PAS domain S-box protein, partial [Brevinematales bacterium]